MKNNKINVIFKSEMGPRSQQKQDQSKSHVWITSQMVD